MGSLLSKFGSSSNGASKTANKNSKSGEGSRESSPAATKQEASAASPQTDVIKPEEKQGDVAPPSQETTTATTNVSENVSETCEKQPAEVPQVIEEKSNVETVAHESPSAVQKLCEVQNENKDKSTSELDANALSAEDSSKISVENPAEVLVSEEKACVMTSECSSKPQEDEDYIVVADTDISKLEAVEVECSKDLPEKEAVENHSVADQKANEFIEDATEKPDEVIKTDPVNFDYTQDLVTVQAVQKSDSIESEVRVASAECQPFDEQSNYDHDDVTQQEASSEECSGKQTDTSADLNPVLLTPEHDQSASFTENSTDPHKEELVQDSSLVAEVSSVVSSECTNEPVEHQQVIQDYSNVTQDLRDMSDELISKPDEAQAVRIQSLEEPENIGDVSQTVHSDHTQDSTEVFGKDTENIQFPEIPVDEKGMEVIESSTVNTEEELVKCFQASTLMSESTAPNVLLSTDIIVENKSESSDATGDEVKVKPSVDIVSNDYNNDSIKESEDTRTDNKEPVIPDNKESTPTDNKELILGEQISIDVDQSHAHDDIVDQSSPAQMLLPVVELAEQLSNIAITSAVKEVTMMSSGVECEGHKCEQKESGDVEVLPDAKNEQDASDLQAKVTNEAQILPDVIAEQNLLVDDHEIQSKSSEVADLSHVSKSNDVTESHDTSSPHTPEVTIGFEQPSEVVNSKAGCEESDGDIEILQDT